MSSGEVENGVKVTEGKAEICFPDSNSVFYNPVQEFNRDLSTAVLKLFSKEFSCNRKKIKAEKSFNNADELKKEHERNVEQAAVDNHGSYDAGVKQDSNSGAQSDQSKEQGCDSGITILEGLAASGLRSVRYALEIPGVKSITANDISADAYRMMQHNIQHNNVQHIVKPSQEDAGLLMYKHRQSPSSRFDAIDLDPYGSASTFLDSAVQAVSDGGILLVTCTDMGVLCGNHSEACFGKYGSMSLKAKFCHEMALRLLLFSLESHANRYKRYIKPLLSISVDFYVRVFVQVFTSASEVKRSASKHCLVYLCVGCGTFHLQPMGRCIEEGRSKKYPPALGPPTGPSCDQCGGKFHLGGPIWKEPIHNAEFVKKLLESVKEQSGLFRTSERIIGLLSVIEEELPECPLYYTVDHLCGVLHCSTPSLVQIRSAVMEAGYRASSSHACRTALKTDAPHNVIWDIMRCWEKLNPVKRKKENSPGTAILSKEPVIQVSFDAKPGANPASRQNKLLRYQENPEANWGPKPRAKRKKDSETTEEKRQRLQGRKTVEEEKDYYKQFPCKRFKSGKCEYGDECKYSHDINLNIKKPVSRSIGSECSLEKDSKVEDITE